MCLSLSNNLFGLRVFRSDMTIFYSETCLSGNQQYEPIWCDLIIYVTNKSLSNAALLKCELYCHLVQFRFHEWVMKIPFLMNPARASDF